MKIIKIKNQDNKFFHSKFNFKSLGAFLTYSKNFYKLLCILLIFIIIISNKNNSDIIFNIKNEEANNIPLIKSNINLSDEFFQIPEVLEQIYNNKLTYVKTLSGGHKKVGNALICLNNSTPTVWSIESSLFILPAPKSLTNKASFIVSISVIYPDFLE